MNQKLPKDPNLKRSNTHALRFNNHEVAAINKYCSKYRIRNKSKFMRETILIEILRRFDHDYPTLFDDQPNLFSAGR